MGTMDKCSARKVPAKPHTAADKTKAKSLVRATS